MKAGGITVVATYIFWIHHEQTEGKVRFDGGLDVAAFVRLCAEIGLDVVLRIGPWCHGEVRNGGFPDWVQEAPVQHRTNDPAYLALVKGWFGRLGEELHRLTGPDTNVMGIQLENELYDQPGHILELKKLARDAGLTAPIWTATAWGGADLPGRGGPPPVRRLRRRVLGRCGRPLGSHVPRALLLQPCLGRPGNRCRLCERRQQPIQATAARRAAPAPDTVGPFPAGHVRAGRWHGHGLPAPPLAAGLDVAAVAHNKIGNGSAWQGYYMFAGGTNPADGLQESQATGYPNDLPRFDYDFHAPIGASGRLAGSFAALRKQHAFLAAFGDRLAQMPSSLPEAQPHGIEDTTTLRWALRSDGTAGFVFITWHQPHIPLPTYEDARFEIALDGGPVTFPGQPVEIPAGTVAHWPVNLEVAGVTLAWATASPLTFLEPSAEDPDSLPTLVLAAEPGIPVELCFAAGTEVHGAGGSDAAGSYRIHGNEPVVATARCGDARLDILVLPAEAVDTAWVLGSTARRELILAGDPVWLDGTGNLAGRSRATPEVLRYRPGARSFEPAAALPALPGVPATGSVEVAAELLKAAGTVPATYGSSANRAAAPDPALITELAQAYRLPLPGQALARVHTELEIHWAGDVARLLVDGAAVADRFWDGSPWVINVSDAGIGPGCRRHPADPPAFPGGQGGAARRGATAPGSIAGRPCRSGFCPSGRLDRLAGGAGEVTPPGSGPLHAEADDAGRPRRRPLPLFAARSAAQALACSARMLSIWPTASLRPSSMPIAMTCSSCSSDSNVDSMVIRVRSPTGSRVTVAWLMPNSAVGLPSLSAKPSSNSSWRGAAMLVNSHQPCALSPSGPVM